MEKKSKKEDMSKSTELYIQLVIIAILSILIVFNAGRVYSPPILTGAVFSSGIIPSGTPEFYGKELKISYDDISPSNPQLADATIARLTEYEDIELNEEQMQRYTKIGSSISCEYCCGAKAIIFPNGERACGCAHSYSMRGLAKYLLTEHPDMTDEQILSELGKWKVLFFPDIHEQKAKILESQGIDSKNYINLASNLYRGIEKGQASGGMVGGC